MAILKVARMGHPVLRARARPVDPSQIGSPRIQQLIDDMFETMQEYQGVGLAAPQIHESLRLFVAGFSSDDDVAMTVAPARFDIARCAGGGIIWSSVATKYQLGFVFQAALLMVPLNASTPHGTCESAMNAALSGATSAANEAGNLALSRNRYPSIGASMGGTGAPGGGSLISVDTDSPLSGAKAAI
jgi:hypothetical protein